MKLTYPGIVCLSLLMSCGNDEELNADYLFQVPANFPEPTYTFENNPVTKEGFELGRKIFFDPILSRDGTISCSSCHVQSVAFADPQHRISIGIENRLGTRNAPPIFNLAFKKKFFWDGGVIHVDFIPLNAIENPLEMDESLRNVIAKMEADEAYPPLFGAAFGTDSVSTPRMQYALSQFMNMMVSSNSRYDQYIRNEGEELNEEELDGLVLFENHCGACHSGQLFTDEGFHNNGLDSVFSDLGRAIISEKEEDNGKFRVPTLRNIALTAPYMHDGRFNSLEEVLEHYSNGVVSSSSIDPLLLEGEKLGIPLSKREQEKIIAFLKTLTDRTFTSDSRFFNPR